MFGARSCIVKQTRYASIANSHNVRSIYSKYSEEDKPTVIDKNKEMGNTETHFTSNQKAREVSQMSHNDSEVQKLKVKVGKSDPKIRPSPTSLLDQQQN